MRLLRLGTRGSQLALWQARAVADAMRRQGGPACELSVIKTSGDRLAEATLSPLGGKRLFVKEIEEALLRGRVDIAVHSAKDLPTTLPDGLEIGAVLPREDPRDALVLPTGSLPKGDRSSLSSVVGPAPRLGTGSARRRAQLARLLPAARFSIVRGNIDTRLRKLDAGETDALVLAAAGLRRLGLDHRITLGLPPEDCVPAAGQGTIAIEIRSDDVNARAAVGLIHDRPTGTALAAERAAVAVLEGGCQVPIGVWATIARDELALIGLVTSLDGRRHCRHALRGRLEDPPGLGRRLGLALLAAGADSILAESQLSQSVVEESNHA